MAVTPSTSSMRFTGRGPFRSISVPTPASVQINQGDLMWLNTDKATPANAFTWTTSLVLTQPGFRLLFLGVANQDKSVLDATTRPIQIITEGLFNFPCAALGGALHIGNYVGPAKDPNNSSLADQLLASVATYDLSSGVLAEEALTGATSLTVFIASYLALCKALKI